MIQWQVNFPILMVFHFSEYEGDAVVFVQRSDINGKRGIELMIKGCKK